MKIYAVCSGEYEQWSPGPFFFKKEQAEEFAGLQGYGDVEDFDLFESPLAALQDELGTSIKWEEKVYGGCGCSAATREYQDELRARICRIVDKIVEAR